MKTFEHLPVPDRWQLEAASETMAAVAPAAGFKTDFPRIHAFVVAAGKAFPQYKDIIEFTCDVYQHGMDFDYAPKDCVRTFAGMMTNGEEGSFTRELGVLECGAADDTFDLSQFDAAISAFAESYCSATPCSSS